MNSNAAFNMIAALDLDPIKMKLMHKESGEGWSLKQANAVAFEYRRFLCLMKLFPHEQTAPRVDVDIFWHYHILDTIKYAADCEQIFGYFLHHSPYSGLQGDGDESVRYRTGARMQELYEATFGEAYIRPEESRTVPAASALAPAKTAWCNPTTANSAWAQPAAAKTAWCNPTTVNPTWAQSAPANTAWCNPTTVNTARAQPALANTAWCNPTTANTAWCNPTTTNAAAAQPALADTAWCNPTTANTAWCNPTTANAGSAQPALADTAWCNPTTETACLRGVTAITVWPQTIPQNNSFYSQAVLAKAA